MAYPIRNAKIQKCYENSYSDSANLQYPKYNIPCRFIICQSPIFITFAAMEIVINSERELDRAVEELLALAGERRVMVFSGEIGAGKTTFIQAICRHFEVREQVTSPTFALINEYTYLTPKGEEANIYHMDLYRLKELDEAINIGLEDYLYTGEYCFIEWPAIIEDLLPEGIVRINITIQADSSRKLVFL